MNENFMLGGGARGGSQKDYFAGMNVAGTNPASPIEAARNALDEATGTLHKVVAALEQRLHMVLGPSGSQGVDGVKIGAERVSITLAQGIGMSASAVNAARERLEEIISRLEL